MRKLPIDRFCHFIWWWLTRDAPNEAEVEKLRLRLWIPPPRVEIPAASPWSAESETAAFAALKAATAG